MIERVLVNSWAVVKVLSNYRVQGAVGAFHLTCLCTCTDVGKMAVEGHLACQVKCQKVN